MSKIIKLTAENVKRLSAVQITPKGNVVVIGGKNGQGKSSCLDAIQYALGGDPGVKMPVRRGEDKARIVVDLGDIVVRRTFTAAGGTSLVVTNADGIKQMSPQAILDKLTGKLTFDPLEFSRQKPDKQSDTLRQIVGLDFTKIEAERLACYTERTNVNREMKALEARLQSMPKFEGLPAEAVSSAQILEEQQKAAQTNARNGDLRRSLKSAKDAVANTEHFIAQVKLQIQRLEEELSNQRTTLKAYESEHKVETARVETLEKEVAELKDIDLSPFQSRMAECEAINRKLSENIRRGEVARSYKERAETSERLTSRIEALDSTKRKLVTEAKYPVEGLAFDASGGVTLNNIPFDQCSSAEQLRVSVAVGLALNPKLRILLIRDGSLLDEDSMKLLCDMAAKADAQVWIEMVGEHTETAVIIEDGHVKGAEPVVLEEPKEAPPAKVNPASSGTVVEGVLL